MDKLTRLLEEVDRQIEANGNENAEGFVEKPEVIGMVMVRDMILDVITQSNEQAPVITITVDKNVSDVLKDFGQHIENFKDGIGARLNEFMSRAEDLEQFKQKPHQIPAEYMHLLSPASLAETLDSLDRAIGAEAAACDAKEASYGGKGDLLRQKNQLETSVKLTEAEAMSKVQGEGKSQYVNMGGEKLYLTNDQARDAYRRMASKTDREELGRINAELGRIEVDQFKATDAWYGAKAVADSIGKKADLQAALLNFLAGRG
jgi:hypothetical protein